MHPLVLIFLSIAALTAPVRAADLAAAQEELQTGAYSAAVKIAEAGVAETPGNEEWHLLLSEALLAAGRYADADTAMRAAVANFPQSIRVRWAARAAATANGFTDRATGYLEDIRRLYSLRAWAYRTPADLVVFGRAALTLGADPKDVLDRVYAVAQRAAPKLRDVYLARGDLALEKHDFALAARAFEDGLKQLPDDPALLYGLARSHNEGDRATMIASIQGALKKNPRHVGSLLLLADHRIDEENYEEASKLLTQIVEIDPLQPDAWALRAVLAHLRNDSAAEQSARQSALISWPTNPRVDSLIGEKLSAKYRFTEGAARQRQALVFDPKYLPAQSQLANDLLRLGQESEGWKLAEAVHQRDAYDVEAYNLATLHDTMSKYASLTSKDFVVRMTSHEAKVYGPQVVDLLTRAKRQLTEKYGVELASPTYIEIFADPKDFAVRTFGMPDVAGFLGVCFGQVVTANSPASTAGGGTNWQAVLWHEFCHVVTLQMTANKMPRWLSEGISVHEERQENPAWGQHMSPRYREMILKGELTPVGKMSAAFLAPPTPLHLQFAYYQSSLVVEYIATKHGLDKLRLVLKDLRDGENINSALAKRIAPIDTLEKEFDAYARAQAEQLGAGLDWEKPDAKLLKPGGEEEFAEWSAQRSNNYWVLLQKARLLMQEKKWAEAKAPLERLLAEYPDQRGGESALRFLATVHRALSETEQERGVLAKIAVLDAEAPDSYMRLMELGLAAKDWSDVALNARRFLQINPLIAPPYRYLAQANAELGETAPAIQANRTLLQLDPSNPAEVHFQLATLLHREGNAEAKSHLLMALEDAPRNRPALELLLNYDQTRGTAVAVPVLTPSTINDSPSNPSAPVNTPTPPARNL